MKTRRGFAGTPEVHDRSFWNTARDFADGRKRFEAALRGRGHDRCAAALDVLVGSAKRLARMDANRVHVELPRASSAAFKEQREHEDSFFEMLGEFRQTCICSRRRA